MSFPSSFASTSSLDMSDLKANGEVSRMRAHKGNMPSLPQTKYCPLCPAKFTRTTHLNRHLRSHTNERLHRCTTCSSQFTRSDLLTRHKRTCGDSTQVNRSRRKSCQACAESKIKCDLQFPCTKCSTRGRQCVFINDPETSRNKKTAAALRASRHAAVKNGVFVTSPPPCLDGPLLTMNDLSDSDSVSSSECCPSLVFDSTTPTPISEVGSFDFMSTPPFSASSSSSSSSSPNSEVFQDFRSPTAMVGMKAEGDQLGLFPCDLFEPLYDQTLNTCQPSHVPTLSQHDFGSVTEYSWMGGDFDTTPDLTGPEVLGYTGAFDDLAFDHSLINAYSPGGSFSSFNTGESESLISAEAFPSSGEFVGLTSSEPSSSELQQYLYLFFTTFTKQMPLIHSATWQLEGKPAVLIRVMHACGALFVNTRTASDFISDTMISTREVLLQASTRTQFDLTEQTHLILAAVLLQTIALFRQDRSGQPKPGPEIYHHLLVRMIKHSGLIPHVAAYAPTDLTDPALLNNAWRDWANHETIKRSLLVAYLQDAYHYTHSGSQPSFQSSEFKICLPCDSSLWTAADVGEWFENVYSPSSPSTGPQRLVGVSMDSALAVLGQMRLPALPGCPENLFMHFVSLHSTIRNSVTNDCYAPPNHSYDSNFSEATLAAHFTLHNWLQGWIHGPAMPEFSLSQECPTLVIDALPFHWLAQVSTLARQPTMNSVNPPARADHVGFVLMNQWLQHVRGYLQRGEFIPPQLFDELRAVRGHIACVVPSMDGDGLLSFFPNV